MDNKVIEAILNQLADDLDVCADYHGDSYQDELYQDVITLYRALGIARPKRKKDFYETEPRDPRFKDYITTEEIWQRHEKEVDGMTS